MGSTSTSSSSKISCFQCEETSSSFDHFRNGWRLRSGEFAQLCPRCASIYEEGKFCEAFHSNDDGWRDCESCGKARSRCLFLEGQPDTTRQTVIEPQYRPRSSDTEVQQISRNFGCVVTPLFEKLLSATDADLKLARLIIPKKCAEAFFPDISEPRGFLLKVQDTEGKEWDFNYRYWINGGSKMYILEGLRDFMISKRWQAGDTVTFYRVEPSGKLVIGLRKTSFLQPPNEK